MARIALTANPVDIIAATAALSAGTAYLVQPESPWGDPVLLADTDAAPTDADARLTLGDLEQGTAEAGDGGRLWAWAPGKSPDTVIWLNVFEAV